MPKVEAVYTIPNAQNADGEVGVLTITQVKGGADKMEFTAGASTPAEDAMQDLPEGELPTVGAPDQSLPGDQPQPDQSLPADQPQPDQTLPGGQS